MFKKIILILIFCLGCGCIPETPDNPPIKVTKVPFKVVSEENSTPVANRKVIVYNGEWEICYELGYDPYPHNDSMKNEPWFITIVQTDNEGKFYLNLSKIKSTDIRLQIGKPYRLIDFEKSSDISHTKSNYHIRIVRFKKGETRVLRNDIYDLRRGILKEISLDDTVNERAFNEIILIAQNK